MKKIYVYDIETYPNIFTFIFRPVQPAKEYLIFEISPRKNDLSRLVSFLKEPQVQVGYNNMYFDYPIIHSILQNSNITIQELYSEIQSIFASSYPKVRDWEVKIEQIDLFKIWHYDNKGRSTSLKWLEFSLRWFKVQDLPFPPGKNIPENMFDKLIEYNINDVDFTYFFLGKSLDAINFRYEMSEFLNHNVMNYSDVKIGEYINRVTYEKNSGRTYYEFKNQRTRRQTFKGSSLIPSYISFHTDSYRNFLSSLRTLSFGLDEEIEFNPVLGNLTINFKKGGIHSQDPARIVKCAEGYYLKEVDVGSMYPKSIIEGNLYPEHLGPTWRLGIKQLYDERVKEMKPRLKTISDKNSKEYKFLNAKQEAYKLAMNGGGYGKTGSEWSWQYDPLVMMKTTFMGQLSLMMLTEQFHINDIEIISANTDGVVIHYPKDKNELVERIKKKWEAITKYELEDTYYSKIIFRNVNNYMAEIIDEKTGLRQKMKFKGGAFLIDPEYHQNNSQRVVYIAVAEYFLKSIPVRDVICNIGYEFLNSKEEKERTTIYDYCIGKKSVDKVENYTLVNTDKNIEYLDKVIRYYISNSSDVLYKIYKSGKREAVNKGFNHTIFMEFKEKKNYDINYDYYIREANKIIEEIERGTLQQDFPNYEQLSLF